MVHGDLTTSNFMVRSGSEEVVAIDFGLASSQPLAEDKVCTAIAWHTRKKQSLQHENKRPTHQFLLHKFSQASCMNEELRKPRTLHRSFLTPRAATVLPASRWRDPDASFPLTPTSAFVLCGCCLLLRRWTCTCWNERSSRRTRTRSPWSTKSCARTR